MILEKDFKEQDNQIIGDANERIEMTIDTENINHLMMIMSTNMYQNPVGSIVREYCSNAIDANIDGKSDNPVIVRLKRDDISNNYFFEVEDYGPGLDDVDFRDIISKYGKSTKKDKEDQLGFYGLGCKSAFSYTPTFNYTCIKEGKERKYLLYKADTGFTIDLINEKSTTEKNGVKVRIPVKNWDIGNFKNEIKNQLAYFDNVYFDVDVEDLNKEYKVFQAEHFQYSSLITTTEMHITLGHVNYPINWEAIGYSRIYTPIALRFGLDSGIFPIPNRENLIWNDKTKQLVKDKIAIVSKWLIEKYNSEIKEMESLLKAWDYIGVTSHYVNLEKDGYRFDITALEKYSSVSLNEVKIKGIEHNSPIKYKKNIYEFFRDYRIIGHIYNGQLKTKNIYTNFNGLVGERAKKGLLLHNDVILSGFFRDYLKTLHYHYFIKSSIHTEPVDDVYYEQLLELKTVSKQVAKDRIKEWKHIEKQVIRELLSDGTNIQNTPEFKKFWEDSKSKKKVNSSKIVQAKIKGEVSIWYPRKKYNQLEYMFNRTLIKLDGLGKNKFMNIILTDEEGKNVAYYMNIFSKQKVQFIKIGIQDLKKVQNLKLHNFMTLKEIEKTKLFKRVVTAYRGRKALELYNTLCENKLEVVKQCANKFYNLFVKVENYCTKNIDSIFKNYDINNAMLLIAENNNIWDETIITEVKELEKGIQDFDFISKLKTPVNGFASELDEYQNLIYNLLLFKKMRYENKLGNLEICVKNELPLDETKLINAPINIVA